MKASEEISIDFFIKQCINKGIDNQYKIVQMAKSEKGTNAEMVRNFISDGKSNPYEHHIDRETCVDCGSNMMFDENQKEYYCPLCD